MKMSVVDCFFKHASEYSIYEYYYISITYATMSIKHFH